MKSNELAFLKEKRESYVLIFILIIIMITGVLIALRIIFYFFQEESTGMLIIEILIRNRDLNFKTNYNLMRNGLIHYYEYNSLTNGNAIYLYFWYFIFYPFSIIPLEISLYIWDLLRFISTIYIAIKISKIIENRRELLFFFLFSGIGYLADMYLNNTNWLIQLLVYVSYLQLEKNRKLLAGIFFTLATFKIILIIIPFIFIITKKIRARDLIYFFIPIILICIPYFIFPDYFLSMAFNWLHSTNTTSSLPLLNLFLMIWRLIQPAHLMFISVIIVIILMNIKNEKARPRITNLISFAVFIFWVLIWIILLELALIF